MIFLTRKRPRWSKVPWAPWWAMGEAALIVVEKGEQFKRTVLAVVVGATRVVDALGCWWVFLVCLPFFGNKRSMVVMSSFFMLAQHCPRQAHLQNKQASRTDHRSRSPRSSASGP